MAVVVSVQTPETGCGEISISVVSVTNTPPAGATFQGPQYEIATQGTGTPLRITFWIDYSARLPGSPAMFRDGLELPSCTGATGLPAGVATCVTKIAPHEVSNTKATPMEITVLADHASSWNIGWYPIPDDGGGGVGGGGTTPPADTTGPVIPDPSTAPATTVRRSKFAFTVGPFSENVTGTVALVSKAIRAGGKKTTIKLAAKPFTATAGKKVKVAFKLSRKQRQLLAKARKVTMTATVIARDALGNPSTRTITFQLKAARKRN